MQNCIYLTYLHLSYLLVHCRLINVVKTSCNELWVRSSRHCWKITWLSGRAGICPGKSNHAQTGWDVGGMEAGASRGEVRRRVTFSGPRVR